MATTPKEKVCLFPEHIPDKHYFSSLDLFPKEEKFKLVWHVEHWVENNHEYGPYWDKYHTRFEANEHEQAVAKFNELLDKHPNAEVQFLGFKE